MDEHLDQLLVSFTRSPTLIVIEMQDPLRKICSQFDASPEFILDRAVEACAYRASAFRDISNFARYLHHDLADVVEIRNIQDRETRMYPHQLGFQGRNKVDLIGTMIAIEQAVLDMLDVFVAYELYLNNTYMPYRFEHLLDPKTMVLRKVDTIDEFLERFR